MTKKHLNSLYLILFILISFCSGCRNKEDINSFTMELEKTGNLNFSLQKTTSINEVDTVTTILTRSGYLSIRKNLALVTGTASGTISDIASGVWQLLVEAKDSTGVTIYRGRTDVNVLGNQTTFVSINLAATSSSGDLVINVSWNKDEGIDWKKYSANPVLTVGNAGSWEAVYVYSPMVLFDGKNYKMWYNGSDGTNVRIGYATSPDGLIWTKYSGNPVINIGSNGSWDDVSTYTPSVVFDGLNYKMWYSGYDGTNYKIGYATSKDGINWTKYSGNPVLTIGLSGTWDDVYVLAPTVIFDGKNYKMWYSGYDGIYNKIGYAISPDGINWTKYSGNPVLNVGVQNSWEATSAYFSNVLFDGQIYKMWYSGYDGTKYRIGYTSSIDGINWTKNNSNPILNIGNTGSWDAFAVYDPSVLYDGKNFKMWYNGYDGSKFQIGYATSP